MAEEAPRTDTPEYGCVSDLAAEQAATAAPAKSGKTATDPAADAAPKE
jgi:hypothetical protein